MELNNIIFPAPKYNFDAFEAYDGEVLYIPKNYKNVPEKIFKNNIEGYDSSFYDYSDFRDFNRFIPTLCLISKVKKKISNNFLIFFHGNAEDMFNARDIADHLRERLLVNVIIVEYPGYSIYQAEKNSDTVLENSLIVFDFIRDILNVPEDNIFVIGRSIGTASALYLSSMRKPAALVTISPFTSVRAIAKNMVGDILKFLIGER